MELNLFSMGTNITKYVLLSSLILFLSSSMALAQQPVFKVYAVSGKVKVHKPGKKYRALKVSEELTGNETIKVDHGAILNLVCSNYIPLQINSGGTYEIASLKSNCEKPQEAFYTRYFEYIWNELFHKHTKPEAAPLQSMKNKGAVSRGCPGIEVYYPVDTLKLVTQNWDLYWNSSGEPAVVSVHNSEYEGMQTYLEEIKGNSIATTEFINMLSDEQINYLQIMPKGNASCSRYPVIKTSKAKFNALINSYTAGLPADKSSSYYFLRSLIEEEHKYLGEALASLNKAIAIEPANIVYKNHLALFKVKYNLK